MQHLYEYGAVPFHAILELIEEMQEERKRLTMQGAEFGHVAALLVPGHAA